MNQPLGGVCIFYPYPCGFSLATLDPSHSPETCTLVLLESLDDPSVWVCELMSRAYSTVSPGDRWDTLQNPPSPWLVKTVNWRVGNLTAITFGNHFGILWLLDTVFCNILKQKAPRKGFFVVARSTKIICVYVQGFLSWTTWKVLYLVVDSRRQNGEDMRGKSVENRKVSKERRMKEWQKI